MNFEQTLSQKLVDLGLSTTEAHIYSLLLQSSPRTAQELAEHLAIGRTNIYPHLKQLALHNLVRELPKKRGYEVTSPSELRGLIASQQLAVQERSLSLEAILPALKELYEGSDHSTTTYPSLKDGEQAILELLTHGQDRAVLHLRAGKPSSQDPSKLPRELKRKGIHLQAITPVTAENYRAYGSADQVYSVEKCYVDGEHLKAFPEVILSTSHLCIQSGDGWTVYASQPAIGLVKTLATYVWSTSIAAQNGLERRWKRLNGKSIS